VERLYVRDTGPPHFYHLPAIGISIEVSGSKRDERLPTKCSSRPRRWSSSSTSMPDLPRLPFHLVTVPFVGQGPAHPSQKALGMNPHVPQGTEIGLEQPTVSRVCSLPTVVDQNVRSMPLTSKVSSWQRPAEQGPLLAPGARKRGAELLCGRHRACSGPNSLTNTIPLNKTTAAQLPIGYGAWVAVVSTIRSGKAVSLVTGPESPRCLNALTLSSTHCRSLRAQVFCARPRAQRKASRACNGSRNVQH